MFVLKPPFYGTNVVVDSFEIFQIIFEKHLNKCSYNY
jgi:hypothetical protein